MTDQPVPIPDEMGPVVRTAIENLLKSGYVILTPEQAEQRVSGEFRDRIAETLYRVRSEGGKFFAPVTALADALIAAGVVADPATLGHAYDKIAELSRKGDEAVRERDRLRAALHDIAALLADEWRDEPPSTFYPEGRRLYRWPGDLRTELKDIFARHGIDTEEPQP